MNGIDVMENITDIDEVETGLGESRVRAELFEVQGGLVVPAASFPDHPR